MSEGLDTVRAEAASARDLPAGAERFLTGVSVEQIETAADALAQLAAATTTQERAKVDPLTSLFQNMTAAKADRQRHLVAALHRPSPQPRDGQGRFTPRAGFDGGARGPMPQRPSPEQAHNETVVQLAGLSRMFGGGSF
jgi:hypothetical protein